MSILSLQNKEEYEKICMVLIGRAEEQCEKGDTLF